MNTNLQTTPIPRRMARLPRDPRGYPIPVVVLRDRQGKPHFTTNDHKVTLRMARERRCHICGQHLVNQAQVNPVRHMWFAGGVLSAFHPDGAYNDGPMHHECMQYAMQVCPYLAVRTWTGEIMDKTLQPDPNVLRLMVDATSIPGRPEVFVAVCVSTYSYTRVNNFYGFKIRQPYIAREYWRHGQQLTEEEAQPLVDKRLAEKLPERKAARYFVRN